MREADLERANLTGVIGFLEIRDMKLAILSNVKGLTKEQLKFAKDHGALL